MSENARRPESNLNIEFRESTDPWSIPVFRFRRLRVGLAYSVFLVAAIVVGITLNDTFFGADRGRAAATAVAVGFWISGWLIQAVAFVLIAKLIGRPIRQLSVGLFGVKAFPRKWSASAALTVSLGTISSLLTLGIVFGLVGGGAAAFVGASKSASIWIAPSVGISSLDSPWLAGAWLCWAQAFLQMIPIERSIGLQILASIVAMLVPNSRMDSRVRVLRALLTAIALVVVAMAIHLYVSRSFPAWLIVLALGMAVWMSAKSRELVQIFVGFQQFDLEFRPTGLRASAGQVIRRRNRRRQIKRAIERERGEAADAERLDEVLHRLHTGGLDSLSKADRELLHRVSERVRKERDADSSSG